MGLRVGLVAWLWCLVARSAGVPWETSHQVVAAARIVHIATEAGLWRYRLEPALSCSYCVLLARQLQPGKRLDLRSEGTLVSTREHPGSSGVVVIHGTTQGWANWRTRPPAGRARLDFVGFGSSYTLAYVTRHVTFRLMPSADKSQTATTALSFLPWISRTSIGLTAALAFWSDDVQEGMAALDFVTKRHVVVEVDGGYHARRLRGDARRDAWLQRAGFRVVRVEAELVLRDVRSVWARIAEELVGKE
jgi:hypothetical protein